MPSGQAQQPPPQLAPYWGELPASKVATSRQRRPSADQQLQLKLQNLSKPAQQNGRPLPMTATSASSSALVHLPADDDIGSPTVATAPPPPAPGPASAALRRVSIQTANTDSPTDSNFSLFASPTRSSFTPAGLAPRPPSYSVHVRHASADLPSPRHTAWRRSASSNQHHQQHHQQQQQVQAQAQAYPAGDYFDANANPHADGVALYNNSNNSSHQKGVGVPPTPPPAPDVPRARPPPLSYRLSGSGSPYVSPYASPVPYGNGPFRPPKQTLTPPIMDLRTPDDFYKEAAAASARHQVQAVRHERPVVTVDAYQPSDSKSRSSSLSLPPGRPKYADERSPLQKLEIKLDTITKEEKRARVEAAERKAREKTALLTEKNAAAAAAAALEPRLTGGENRDMTRERERDRGGEPHRDRDRGQRPRIVSAPQPHTALVVNDDYIPQSPREEPRPLPPPPPPPQSQPQTQPQPQSQPQPGNSLAPASCSEERRQRRREERAEGRREQQRVDERNEQLKEQQLREQRYEQRYEPRHERKDSHREQRPEPRYDPYLEQEQPIQEPPRESPKTPAREPAREPAIPFIEQSLEEPVKQSVEPVVDRRVDTNPEVGSGVPKRNLSFRERAANSKRKDLHTPIGGSPSSDSAIMPTDRRPAIPVRTSSNKLRKEPPYGHFDHPQNGQSPERSQHTLEPAPQMQPTVRSIPPPAWVSASQQAAAPRSSTSARHEPTRPITARPGTSATTATTADAFADAFKRRATEPARSSQPDDEYDGQAAYVTGPRGNGMPTCSASVNQATGPKTIRPVKDEYDEDGYDDEKDEPEHEKRLSRLVFDKSNLHPRDTVYRAPKYLREWKTATTGQLFGSLLDLAEDMPPAQDKPWWDLAIAKASNGSTRRRNSISSRPWKAEAYDGEYDDSIIPTRFKPALLLECGPLLRYCGIRHEKALVRNSGLGSPERQIWRGTIMIVTRDEESSYDIAPTLRLFVQPIALLPPPPAEIQGEDDLPPEYVDPIAGHPKLGRKGETLYVRPIEHLEEARDLSWDESDDGIYERARSSPDVPLGEGVTELHGSFAGRRKRTLVDGESASKFRDVKGFRLNSERGVTFWRFNIEVELRSKQQRIAYRINRGPSMGFWVPAMGQSMNVMFHNSNGFNKSDTPNDFCGPDPMWRDVLNTHQTQPFHVMVGGGDQIYNDVVGSRCGLFREWLGIQDDAIRLNCPFTPEMQAELEGYYLERYCMCLSQGLFSLATSQIPMVNMWDDRDIFNDYGSYPDHEMASPVFSGLGAVAFKYYMLFQHQSTPDETEVVEPSWITGARPGPYIHERSRSVYVSLGSKMALLAVDCRTERDELDVVRDETWKKIMDRCYADVARGQTQHLLIVLSVPLAYPRTMWLENTSSRLMTPIKALGRAGIFGNTLNKIEGGPEVLDDLTDHWTAKHHKEERAIIIKDLRDLAAIKSVRITVLSGDVHLAAVGQFYSNPKKHRLPKHEDFRYIPNIISSGIVNPPPAKQLADTLDKRNKMHQFDVNTVEDMAPLFVDGIDGKPRTNTRLLPHRNWLSIREFVPGTTLPPSPTSTSHEPRPGMFRRLSSKRQSQNNPAHRSEMVLNSRPPPSSGGGFFRSISTRRGSVSAGPIDARKPRRSSSVGSRVGSIFGSLRRKKRSDDGGINDNWGDDSDYEPADPLDARKQQQQQHPMRDREYETGDEGQFTAHPLTASRPRTQDDGRGPTSNPRSFRRADTDPEFGSPILFDENAGALDISINAEVCPTDPAGITKPYRMIVPRLVFRYEESKDYTAVVEAERGGMGVYDDEDDDLDAAEEVQAALSRSDTKVPAQRQQPQPQGRVQQDGRYSGEGYFDDYQEEEEEEEEEELPTPSERQKPPSQFFGFKKRQVIA